MDNLKKAEKSSNISSVSEFQKSSINQSQEYINFEVHPCILPAMLYSKWEGSKIFFKIGKLSDITHK